LTSYFFRLVIGNMIPDTTIFAASHLLMNFDFFDCCFYLVRSSNSKTVCCQKQLNERGCITKNTIRFGCR